MNAVSISFTFVLAALLIILPRRFAVVPLLIGAAYVPRDAVLELGPAHFTVFRLLVAFGIVRALVKRERLANGINPVDRLLILWSIVLLGSSAFHDAEAWVFRAGIVWTDLGSYFLFRVLVRDWEDVRRVFKIVCIALVPVAALMLVEKFTGADLFSVFGGWGGAILRHGDQIRARGPFAHPILAGTVGATCFPMAVYLWRRHRAYALAGLFSATGIVVAASSSGPILMILFILIGMMLWNVRNRLREIRWIALLGVIGLDVVMKDPVYFVMARVDITGGSQSWYRARLIQSAFEHLNEWWLTGTDYTRHWMPTGIDANAENADITNHILQMGVWGGLPLMVIFILLLLFAFRTVGRALRANGSSSKEHRFLIWTLGAILFGHVMHMLSISLFDQSVVFLYLVLAGIGAVQVAKRPLHGRVRSPNRGHRPLVSGGVGLDNKRPALT